MSVTVTRDDRMWVRLVRAAGKMRRNMLIEPVHGTRIDLQPQRRGRSLVLDIPHHSFRANKNRKIFTADTLFPKFKLVWTACGVAMKIFFVTSNCGTRSREVNARLCASVGDDFWTMLRFWGAELTDVAIA
jgi:hypothetical protein